MKQAYSDQPVHAQFYKGFCCPLIHCAVNDDSVNGQRRPRSDCADAQSDLGRRCPHMPEDSPRVIKS